jgi:hypothetical protein
MIHPFGVLNELIVPLPFTRRVHAVEASAHPTPQCCPFDAGFPRATATSSDAG